MIENSGFLESKRLYNIPPKKAGTKETAPPAFLENIKLNEFFTEKATKEKWKWDLYDHVEYIYGKDDHKNADDSCGKSIAGPKHYHSHSIGLFKGKASIIYIWSILFSQLVVSILIGIVLQLLWEDRAITEPL